MSNSWWETSDGEDLRHTDASKDLPTNSGFDPLPNNTKVLAVIDSAGKGEKDGNYYAEATMTILKPDGYANRKIFPRWWIFDDNPHATDKKKKRDNDMRRFVKLDAACGGKLAKAGREPDGDDIAMAFVNKQVIVNVMLMEPGEADKKPFNWYSDYFLKNSRELSDGPAPKQGGSGRKPQSRRDDYDDLDDDSVPF